VNSDIVKQKCAKKYSGLNQQYKNNLKTNALLQKIKMIDGLKEKKAIRYFSMCD